MLISSTSPTMKNSLAAEKPGATPDERRSSVRRNSIGNFQGFVGDNETYLQKLHSLSSNTVFIKLTLSLSGLFFVVTGIQYWLPDYMTNILQSDQATVSWYYSFLSFTAPISGVVVSGIVTAKLGGYNT